MGARLAEGADDDPRQPVEPLLGDVVGRPILQRLDGDILAERPGDEDEGNRRAVRPRDGEGAQAVEGRQDVVGQDQVMVAAAHPGHERFAGHDPVEPVGPADAVEDDREQLRVEVAVFEEQDAQRRLGAVGKGVAHALDGQPPRCGGGSFSTAQNTPRS